MPNTQFNYEEFVREKLNSNPIGRPREALHDALPETADEDRLDDTIERLNTNGTIKKIGNNWRWMSFD